MKHRDRVQMALAHQIPDRCPMYASFVPEFAARVQADLGQRGTLNTTDRAAHNPHGSGNTYEIERAIGQDMLMTNVGWANSYDWPQDRYVDEWGVTFQRVAYRTPFGVGHYTDPVVHPLADDAALDGYVPPDPNRAELYEHAAMVLKQFGDEYWICGGSVTTVFEAAEALRGYENLMADFLTDPDITDRILDIPFNYHRVTAARLAAMGVDMIWLGDDIGMQTGMLINPVTWRRFLKPRLAAIIAGIKAANPNCKVAYHTDGKVWDVLPELIEVGVDVLNPIQPAALDPDRLKKEYGGRLCFWGSVDEQRTLPFGSPDDVRAETKRRILDLGEGGGLIVGPAQHLQLDTPLENFWAMHETIMNTPCR
jgi:uroporphyrinogen decarboxylase